MRKYLIIFLAFPVVCAFAFLCCSCPSCVGLQLVATIKDIMDSAVDPSADYIWESIGTEVSAAGIVDHRPQNDDEWKEERRRAVLLVEAANLLMMPGRKVAKAGEKAENPEVELSPEEIEALINKDRPTFIRLAKEFQKTAIEQLKAVDDTQCYGASESRWRPRYRIARIATRSIGIQTTLPSNSLPLPSRRTKDTAARRVTTKERRRNSRNHN